MSAACGFRKRRLDPEVRQPTTLQPESNRSRQFAALPAPHTKLKLQCMGHVSCGGSLAFLKGVREPAHVFMVRLATS